jgi:hypothetical protein
MNARYDRWLAEQLRQIRQVPQPDFRIGETVNWRDPEDGTKITGTVTTIYANFNTIKNTGLVDDAWYEQLDPPADLPKDQGPWYSVLFHGGGEILVDESRLVEHNPREDTNG